MQHAPSRACAFWLRQRYHMPTPRSAHVRTNACAKAQTQAFAHHPVDSISYGSAHATAQSHAQARPSCC